MEAMDLLSANWGAVLYAAGSHLRLTQDWGVTDASHIWPLAFDPPASTPAVEPQDAGRSPSAMDDAGETVCILPEERRVCARGAVISHVGRWMDG